MTKSLEKRLMIISLLVVLIFVGLTARLSYLQLYQTEKYKTMSEQNRMRLIPIPAPRGQILDKNGVQLVKDRPVYAVSIAYINDQKSEEMIDKLSGILGLSVEDVAKLKQTVKESQLPKYEPIRVMKDVPIETITKIEERRDELPNVIIDVEPQRQYLKGNLMPQVLGYTREINDNELKANKDKGYKLGDRFGKAGLEKQYQSFLKGIDGAHQVEVNNQGRALRDLGLKEPIPGDNLTLTVDANLQSAAETSLDNAMKSVQSQFPDAKAGSLVMLDVNTGKVLAMVSRPGYDPNIFNHTLSQSDSDTLFTAKPPAAINRAFSAYPPGSTYKMLTGTAGLQSGISASTTFNDPGSFSIPGVTFKCWQSWGHGQSNIIRALAVSCDVYFYNVADRIGVDNIVKYGKEYGFGQSTGIDLPDDVNTGTLPSPQWKEKIRGPQLRKEFDKKANEIKSNYEKLINEAQADKDKKRLTRERDRRLQENEREYKIKYNWWVKWQRYETINMAIGQGDNQITPLQLANYVATIANGGTRFRPYLVDKITDSNGKLIKQTEPEVVQKLSVSPENLATIRKGMAAATQSSEGTASGLFMNWPVKVAAKTGTAETSSQTDKIKTANHGLFVAFAPYDKPQVAVAAIIEFGGHGASAGAAVRDLLATYFNINIHGGAAYGPE